MVLYTTRLMKSMFHDLALFRVKMRLRVPWKDDRKDINNDKRFRFSGIALLTHFTSIVPGVAKGPKS